MRKVLVMTYYWPPAGGPGVQRVLKFVKFLPEFGWQPVILTTRGHDAPAHDPSLLDKIPPEAVVYTSATMEPFQAYKRLTGRKPDERLSTNLLTEGKDKGGVEGFMRWIRANLFIPDARSGSVPFLYRKGLEVIRHEKPDVIFSTSPPHSLQLAARKLARKCGLPWVADLRDPWSQAYWLKDLPRTALARHLDGKMENRVLRGADVLTSVSEGLSEMFREQAGKRAVVLHNGFETASTTRTEHDKFIILFIGDLSRIQDPGPLLMALDRFTDAQLARIELHFIGRIYAECHGILKKFRRINALVKEYMPIKELMLYARKASLLFKPFTDASYSSAIIQAKTFDYLAMRKPILAFDTADSITANVLKETGSGRAIAMENADEIFTYIFEWYNEWLVKRCLLLEDHRGLDPYRSRTSAGRLAEIFGKLAMGVNRIG